MMHANNIPSLASLIAFLLLLPLLPFSSHAQNLSDLPPCAESPALSAIGSTGCQSSDFKCLCKDNTFIDNALAGAEKQCPPDDLTKVIAFAQQICGGVGVSLSISATAAGSSSTTPSSSSTPITSTPATASSPPLSSATSGSPSTLSQPAAVAAATPSPTSQGSTSGAPGRNAVSALRGIMMCSGAAVAVVGCWVLLGVGA